jgi:DNA ligase (NAD+)
MRLGAIREEGDSVRRCTGGLICPAQAGGAAEAFRLPRRLRHRGAGREADRGFFADGWIREPADIFTLAARDGGRAAPAQEPRGLGREIGRQPLRRHRERRRIPLRRLIFALGIRHVGETSAAARPPLRHMGASRGDGGRARARGRNAELNAIDGVGEVMAALALADFFHEPANPRRSTA